MFLRPSTDALIARLRGDGERPPLTELPLEAEVTRLVRDRDPLYREVADLVLDVPADEALATTFERLRDRLGIDSDAE